MSSLLFGAGDDPAADEGAVDPLAPEPEPEPTPGPSFGALKKNAAARGRREKVKFFDSADWASGRQNTDSQTATPDRLSALTQAPAANAPVVEGEASILTGE
jgi:hypothetical protein